MDKLKRDEVVEAIRAITKANDRLIADTWDTYHLDVIPLPGTIPYAVYICWRMAEELGYEPEED